MGQGPEQIILQTGHTEGPETHERMLAIREMQIETTMREHSTPGENGHHNQSANKCW